MWRPLFPRFAGSLFPPASRSMLIHAARRWLKHHRAPARMTPQRTLAARSSKNASTTKAATSRMLEEVGRQFQVTCGRIRRIEAKALRKPRLPTRLRKLDGFIKLPCCLIRSCFPPRVRSGILFSWPFPNTASRSRASRRSGPSACAWNGSAVNARLLRLPKSPTTVSRGSKNRRLSMSSWKSPAGSMKPSQNGHHRRTIHRSLSRPTPGLGHWRTRSDRARLQPIHHGRRCLARATGFTIRLGRHIAAAMRSLSRPDRPHASRLAAACGSGDRRRR
jgi:hypothetical protein